MNQNISMHKKRVSLPIKAEFFHSFHGFLCSSSRLTVEDEIVIFNIWFSNAKFLFELCWAHAKCLSDLWHWKIKNKLLKLRAWQSMKWIRKIRRVEDIKHFQKLTRMVSCCANDRRKRFILEIETELISNRNLSNIFLTPTYKVCSQTSVFFLTRQVRVAPWHQKVVYHHL